MRTEYSSSQLSKGKDHLQKGEINFPVDEDLVISASPPTLDLGIGQYAL